MRASIEPVGRASSADAQQPHHARLLAAILTVLSVYMPSILRAQEFEIPLNSVVQARVAASGVYDDNVYLLDRPTADFIWRVTPKVSMQKRSPRLTLLSYYTFDAERFAEQTSLTTPFARQAAVLESTIRLTSTATVTMNAGYVNTTTAADLNMATTGVTGARLPATGWRGGSRLRRSIGPSIGLEIDYSFVHDRYSAGSVANHTGEVRFSRRIDSRQQWHLRGQSRWFQFDSGQGIPSQVAVAGWAAAVTPTVTVNLEGGTRYTPGTFRPELSASIRHRAGNRQMSASYALTQEMALGVDGIIDVQRVQAELAHRPKAALQAALQAAVFDNSAPNRASRVYNLAVLVARPFARRFSVELSYTRDIQRAHLGQFDVPLQRNTASARFIVSS